MSSASDSSIFPIESPFLRSTTPVFDFEKVESSRPCSPSSSIGSHGSGISHPPGTRKRRRTTLTNVSSDALLRSINDWDDGQDLKKSRGKASSTASPPHFPGSELVNWSGSQGTCPQTPYESSNEATRESPHETFRRFSRLRCHPYYSLSVQSDGKYHCPFPTGKDPCFHHPTARKLLFQPYHCEVPACSNSHLCFSSLANLLRHQRVAHGLYGNQDTMTQILCHFSGCERSKTGFGFARRYQLHDHMQRVHHYGRRRSSSETSTPGTPQKDSPSSELESTTEPIAVPNLEIESRGCESTTLESPDSTPRTYLKDLTKSDDQELSDAEKEGEDSNQADLTSSSKHHAIQQNDCNKEKIPKEPDNAFQQELDAEIDRYGLLKLSQKTARRCYQTYNDRINTMHPFLGQYKLETDVNHFIGRHCPQYCTPGILFREQLFSFTEGAQAHEDVNAPSDDRRGAENAALASTRPLVERYISNAIILLVFALGAICESKSPLQDWIVGE
ncbi:hypothetical protein PENSTE_c001G08591 [Penicillium steckii]|uniref:C2H2-type domain-containing protein n=1 Tax=Penicillium steckii TaxID=303698 RepID=A0A1V6U1A4_9EURO|nr:hypothetical protein PENSTE_c001G08591 [Penicillium steckii]